MAVAGGDWVGLGVGGDPSLGGGFEGVDTGGGGLGFGGVGLGLLLSVL